MAVEVFVANEQDGRAIDCLRWADLAKATLAAEGVRGDAELSVLFVDEATIAALNERFLEIAGPTDVLAFPIDEDQAAFGRSPDNGGSGPGWETPEDGSVPLLIGDVVICPEVAWRNAPHHAGSFDDEIALLLVHGILHLLGMDHERPAEADAMEAREQELLDELFRAKET
ncbi:MAG TPA: rRNA maturation RNase YbeY [Acidimicrobiales bacterium]|nr:rRNA maturation RNase YbeY [Acidimicrobiales bacterium]